MHVNSTSIRAQGLALDSAGDLYVADVNNFRVRLVSTSSGNTITIAGDGSYMYSDGPALTSAGIWSPVGVAVNSALGTVYVTDGFNHIRQITLPYALPAAPPFPPLPPWPPSPPPIPPPPPNPPSPPPMATVSTLAGSVNAFLDGVGAAASFSNPVGLAIAPGGSIIWVADANNYRIRAVTADGTVTTLAGNGTYGCGDGTNGSAVSFERPQSVTADARGYLYVGDVYCNSLRVVTIATGATSTLAGNASAPGYGYFGPPGRDGVGAGATFRSISVIAVNPISGVVYVADENTIRHVTPAGVVTTLPVGAAAVPSPPSPPLSPGGGSGSSPYPESAAASLGTYLGGLALSASGTTLYISDSNNHCIRALDLGSNALATLAGSCGSYGYADGPGTSARLFNPQVRPMPNANVGSRSCLTDS